MRSKIDDFDESVYCMVEDDCIWIKKQDSATAGNFGGQVICPGETDVRLRPNQGDSGKGSFDRVSRVITRAVIHHDNFVCYFRRVLDKRVQASDREIARIKTDNDNRNVNVGGRFGDHKSNGGLETLFINIGLKVVWGRSLF
jgi:hypothetical protein